ncbi:PREDICTED: BTB/POZ domain-containing protein At3g19850-like [Nicotiana attenuata]|uniref:Btbpoz domain-containing protein n=1 Tax=Nicotiana attenuata TaxID=49451 RepID=A0A1J6KUK2_NICAT|nr:PREDICTED: BTB/POZ domain-containing protein At3g19850-like [Nicotiana attenuata]OIT22769.1 btbpoz domain-containing protein [Nicotiana attenuata]
MPDLCDLQIHVNGQQTFFIHEKVLSRFCGKLRKIIKEEKRRSQIRKSGIEIDDFPGGAEGFELVSRFCYNNGSIIITVSNVSLLHCCAVSLGMTEKLSSCNLLHQTETFLEGLFYWSWADILTSLRTCESFFSFADSCGLIQKLMNSLLAKIAQNSDVSVLFASSSSSSSSPDTPNGLFLRTPSSSSSSNKAAWWFEDLTILSPKIIQQFLKTLGAFGSDNNNLVLTRFLLHYLKTATQCKGNNNNLISRSEYTGLADTAVHGVVLMGKTAFSCRSLFWVLRIVSGFGLSRECKAGLEKLIGGLLDQATLDDLLICGHNGDAYDVNLVVRLIRLFVHHDKVVCIPRMMKVGRLIDNYLREIAPDQSLKISKFLAIAESLPDYARDSFDGVYRAIDIYLESHPAFPLEERSRLCRCLNYDKLSLEACKDLAKNPRIPPRIAVQALASQGSNFVKEKDTKKNNIKNPSSMKNSTQMDLYKKNKNESSSTNASDHHQSFSPVDDGEDAESEHMRLNLQRMQWKVVELEKVCREMKGQMSRMVKTPSHNRALPRLC